MGYSSLQPRLALQPHPPNPLYPQWWVIACLRGVIHTVGLNRLTLGVEKAHLQHDQAEHGFWWFKWCGTKLIVTLTFSAH